MSLVPSYEAVIDCERRVLEQFSWNFNFILPVVFLRAFLAQGILFTSELKPYQERLESKDYVTL